MKDGSGHRSIFRINSYISSKEINAMAASPHSIDETAYLDELLAQASSNLMPEMLKDFINQALSTQADQSLQY